jgi:hypothetical protein
MVAEVGEEEGRICFPSLPFPTPSYIKEGRHSIKRSYTTPN